GNVEHRLFGGWLAFGVNTGRVELRGRVESSGAVGDEPAHKQDRADNSGQPEEIMRSFHCDNSRTRGSSAALRSDEMLRPIVDRGQGVCVRAVSAASFHL